MANFNINKAIIGGRLTSEPELKQTPGGVMAAFTATLLAAVMEDRTL